MPVTAVPFQDDPSQRPSQLPPCPCVLIFVTPPPVSLPICPYSCCLLVQVMPSILLLFQSPDREVVKVAIMFLRVALATMDSSAFEAMLPAVRAVLRCVA